MENRQLSFLAKQWVDPSRLELRPYGYWPYALTNWAMSPLMFLLDRRIGLLLCPLSSFVASLKNSTTFLHSFHLENSFLTNMATNMAGPGFMTKIGTEVQSSSSWYHHSKRLQWLEPHISFTNESIHHRQHSSFLTNMAVGQGLIIELKMPKGGVSPTDVIIGKRLEWSQPRFSLSLTQLSIIIKHISFLTNRTVEPSFRLTYRWSFSFWCHLQGQPWRRGSSVSFLIFKTVLHETNLICLSPKRNYPSSSTQKFSD